VTRVASTLIHYISLSTNTSKAGFEHRAPDRKMKLVFLNLGSALRRAAESKSPAEKYVNKSLFTPSANQQPTTLQFAEVAKQINIAISDIPLAISKLII
jgi:hypothetical protein